VNIWTITKGRVSFFHVPLVLALCAEKKCLRLLCTSSNVKHIHLEEASHCILLLTLYQHVHIWLVDTRVWGVA
jgi:hypothetical protein